MKFIDRILIFVRSGDGGDGMVSFHRARNKPKSGVDGGDGGFGGDVYVEADPQLNTLSSLRYRKVYRAGSGDRGGSSGKTGADGADLVVRVPRGTQCYDDESARFIGEVVKPGERLMVAKGGKRGLGNKRWVSPTHQAPEEHTLGGEGIKIALRLELKLLADVGLAGFPNSGKSTLLSRITAAKPKIADCPFTTLTPVLGVVDLHDGDKWERSFVVADIPGLIEGASEGRGLGHAFLRHIERTKTIVYIIDPFNFEEMPPRELLDKLRIELRKHNPILVEKRQLVVLTKMDLAPEGWNFDEVAASLDVLPGDVIAISAVKGTGLVELKRRLMAAIDEERLRLGEEPEEAPEIKWSGEMTPGTEGDDEPSRS